MDQEAYRFLHEIRAKVDGIMVGCETVRTDNPSLTVRYVEGKSPTTLTSDTIIMYGLIRTLSRSVYTGR